MTDSSTVPGGGMRSSGPTAELWPPPESLRPTLFGERWMISAGHPLVAEVGARAFEAGGNAIDAGIAAGLAANVVQADMCNLGGVAPMVVRIAGDETIWSVAGLGWWGAEASVEAHLERHGGDMPAGGACAVIPAAAAAWIAALRRFGTWSFERASSDARELAREGFPIDYRLAQSLEICGQAFRHWPSSAVIYWPEGRPPRPGERLVQEDLANLLEALADAEGSALARGASREDALTAAHRHFYEGEPARRIAEFVNRGGGWMTAEDLAAFEAEIEPAISVEYEGWRVAVNDTWSQGPALLQTLNVLSHFDLASAGHNTAEYIHLLAEAIKIAFSDRERYYGDPRYVDVPLDELLSERHAAELVAMIDPGRALPNLPTLPERAPDATRRHRRLDTTYLCTADADGNVLSAMPSDTLDGGPVVPGLGIMCSPRGVQSRLDPDHPAAIAAGKRPRLTPAPAIATRSGERLELLPLGCPGGDVILQGMLQAFLNLVVFEMTPQQAVEAPRIGAFSYPDSFFPNVHVDGRISVEGRIDPAVREQLAALGHEVVTWPDWEFDAGGVAMIRWTGGSDSALLAGAADPRRSGYVIGR